MNIFASCIEQWSSAVKALWDEDSWSKIDFRVLLSGSSSLLVQKGLSESLMGRFETLYSTHWSFTEMKQAFGYSYEDLELSYRKILGQLDDRGNSATVAHYLELLSHAGLL